MGLSFDIAFSQVSLGILAIIWIHMRTQASLDDRRSRLFRKLILLSLLDISMDVLSTIVPDLSGLRTPIIYMVLTSVYFQLNAFMSYTVFHYTDTLREPHTARSKPLFVAAGVIGFVNLLLLIINIPTHLLFYYDKSGLYYHGPLYYSIYALTFAYFVLSFVNIILHLKQYSKRRRSFLIWTMTLLLSMIVIQFMFPRYLTIDLGIALAVMSFYLHTNNPGQYTDASTGALDRSYFEDWVHEQIQKEKHVYLIAVNVTHLENANVLKDDQEDNRIIKKLAESLRELDHENCVFRLTGSSILIHSHTIDAYEDQLERVTGWCEEEFMKDVQGSGCGLQIVSITCAERLMPEYSIYSYIDYLLRTNHSQDKFCSIESNPETLAGFRYNKEIERYLHEAVENDWFTLAYQPIYHLKQNRYNAVEVLSRLNHPTMGRLDPQRIINVAERSGLISQITVLQFRRLCSFLQENPDVFDTIETFKFNLSPMELLDSSFVMLLTDEIFAHGLTPNRFEFEITESVATEMNGELEKIVAHLQEMGIALSLDDFGSGYANLSNVLQIPFQSVKLDRSLILRLGKDEKTTEFYKGIVRIMQNYGLEIICEGVESKEEADLLSRWNVDMIQGYYYSKPLSSEQFLNLLADERAERTRRGVIKVIS